MHVLAVASLLSIQNPRQADQRVSQEKTLSLAARMLTQIYTRKTFLYQTTSKHLFVLDWFVCQNFIRPLSKHLFVLDWLWDRGGIDLISCTHRCLNHQFNNGVFCLFLKIIWNVGLLPILGFIYIESYTFTLSSTTLFQPSVTSFSSDVLSESSKKSLTA